MFDYMKKIAIKGTWESIKSRLINPIVKEKVFLIIATLALGIICLGCMVINFINKEIALAYTALAYGVALFAYLVVETSVFIKGGKKVNPLPFALIYVALSASLTICYLFLAPSDSLYLFWLCIVPILYILAFGFKRGMIASAVLLIAVVSIFYVPFLDDLSRSHQNEHDLTMKGFFLVYYIAVTLVSAVLEYFVELIIKELGVLKDEYFDEANTDTVTGLRNQLYYLSYVNKLHKTVKLGDSIGLMFIDIDDFKIYNDKYGHTVGNEILIAVAKKLNEIPHALCVRWGGDEFAIVERNLTKDEFVAKANYLLKSVEGLGHNVTISIGLAYYVVDENFDVQKIFNEADMQAIRAKGKGKNCLVINEDN